MGKVYEKRGCACVVNNFENIKGKKVWVKITNNKICGIAKSLESPRKSRC